MSSLADILIPSYFHQQGEIWWKSIGEKLDVSFLQNNNKEQTEKI